MFRWCAALLRCCVLMNRQPVPCAESWYASANAASQKKKRAAEEDTAAEDEAPKKKKVSGQQTGKAWRVHWFGAQLGWHGVFLL